MLPAALEANVVTWIAILSMLHPATNANVQQAAAPDHRGQGF